MNGENNNFDSFEPVTENIEEMNQPVVEQPQQSDVSSPSGDFYNADGIQYVPQTKKSGGVNVAVVIIAVILSALIGAGSATFVFTASNNDKGIIVDNTSSTTSEPVTELLPNTEPNQTITINGNVTDVANAVYKKCANSVVGIRTTAYVAGFFGGSQESSGEGSGVVYSADGYIITNYHVIAEVVEKASNNSKIEVYFMTDTTNGVEATLVGYNVSSDLAVIKVKKEGLQPIEVGNSDEISVGQTAVAIGSPGGLEFIGSVSSGVISGLNRSITVKDIGTLKVIQTDAAINPGNSGGALLNANGQLIGVNSSKLVSSSYEGMGFAIPSNTVVEIIDKIIANKDNPTPYIGIEVYSYGSDFFDAYSLPHGAAVKSVVQNAPAAKAGIQSGDIITEFNGVTIEEYQTLFDELEKCKPNDRVTVKLYRSGRYYTTSVTIGSNNGI